LLSSLSLLLLAVAVVVSDQRQYVAWYFLLLLLLLLDVDDDAIAIWCNNWLAALRDSGCALFQNICSTPPMLKHWPSLCKVLDTCCTCQSANNNGRDGGFGDGGGGGSGGGMSSFSVDGCVVSVAVGVDMMWLLLSFALQKDSVSYLSSKTTKEDWMSAVMRECQRRWSRCKQWRCGGKSKLHYRRETRFCRPILARQPYLEGNRVN
jgi:hypothetical protein